MNEKAKQPLKGEVEIATLQLEAIPNQYKDRDYTINITLPEFTCNCPRTGYPDFAKIHIAYCPDQSIVELKTLKIYINRYRDTHQFHEPVVNKILDDLVKCLQPRWMTVVGDFNPRGNVKTVVETHYSKEEGFLAGAVRVSSFDGHGV